MTKMMKKNADGGAGGSVAIDVAGESIDGVPLDCCQYCNLAEILGFDSWNSRNLGSSQMGKWRERKENIG